MMGTFYGIKPRIVTSADVNSITLTNATIVSASTGDIDTYGGYQLYITNDTASCSSSGVYLELKDNISWSYLTFEIVLTGYAACWNFISSGWGGITTNIYDYNESLGDVILHPFNSWEYPEFQTHDRTSACDNNADNFFHGSFQKGDPKTFIMKRRRNVNGSLGGIYHMRACSSTGTTLIRKIRIWA